MYPAEKVRKKLSKIRTRLLTHYYLAPTNFAKERIKFSKDNSYNPQFIYPSVPLELFRMFKEQIEYFEYPKSNKLEEEIIRRKIKETKLKLELLMSIGTPSVIETSHRLYRLKFTKEALKSAKKDSSTFVNTQSGKIMRAPEIINAIKRYLKKYQINKFYSVKLENWKVVLSNRYDFTFQIFPKSKLIKVGKMPNISEQDIEYSLAHEIDGHVLRAQNAARQDKKIHRNLFPFYIKTEEGLACYMGDYFSPNGEVSKKKHAIRYLASYFAKTHSFSQTYKFLTDHGTSPEIAFQKTFRIKRGLCDTEMPGAFAREAIYYEGMIEVKNYLNKGGDIRKLYAGKVGLDMINYLPIPKNQILPERLLQTPKLNYPQTIS